MTPDEQRVADITERVRKTICPTFSSNGKESIEGRITRDDFDTLLASRLAWKLVADHNGKLAQLTPTQQTEALEKALERTTADWLRALDEIDNLKGASALKRIAHS